MAEHFFYEEESSWAAPLPRKIGIVFCTSRETEVPKGRESEKVSDCEVLEVADATQTALTELGCSADLIDLDPDQITSLRKYDWVFNLAETIFGFPLADYQVAHMMEKEQIQFTGSNSSTLQACLNKVTTKCQLLRNGIGTPMFEVFLPGQSIINWLDYPLIVKPACEDGSTGITLESVVYNFTELECQVTKVHQVYQQAALVEQFIDGRDITASILGNGSDSVVLPLSEITYPEMMGPKFLTFNAKWLPGTSDYQVTTAKCPCPLDPWVEKRMKEIALRAYQVMGCRDYARVDFRVKGNLPYVLEVNPNPCINPDDSGFVRSSKASGLTYTQMIAAIIRSSVKNRCQEMDSFCYGGLECKQKLFKSLEEGYNPLTGNS